MLLICSCLCVPGLDVEGECNVAGVVRRKSETFLLLFDALAVDDGGVVWDSCLKILGTKRGNHMLNADPTEGFVLSSLQCIPIGFTEAWLPSWSSIIHD